MIWIFHTVCFHKVGQKGVFKSQFFAMLVEIALCSFYQNIQCVGVVCGQLCAEHMADMPYALFEFKALPVFVKYLM